MAWARWLFPVAPLFPILATLLSISDTLDGAHLWPQIPTGRRHLLSIPFPMAFGLWQIPSIPIPMAFGLWQIPPPYASCGKLFMAEFFYGNKEEDDMWVLNVIYC